MKGAQETTYKLLLQRPSALPRFDNPCGVWGADSWTYRVSVRPVRYFFVLIPPLLLFCSSRLIHSPPFLLRETAPSGIFHRTLHDGLMCTDRGSEMWSSFWITCRVVVICESNVISELRPCGVCSRPTSQAIPISDFLSSVVSAP